MRRWNGWGDEANSPPPLPDHAREFLASKLGKGQPLPEAEWNEVITQVPASRLPDHPLITTCSTDRVLHARGQSLPDWLALRSGKLDIFPDGVAYPECREDIQELLSYASTHSVEVIPYGGGTSVAGHITPRKSVRPILTIDLCRMNRLINLDTDSQIATSGPGTSGPLVESQLRAKGYTLGHFPQSFELSTLGGWVASRSSGQQSLRYGRIEQLFAGGCLETFAGPLEIPSVPASAAGPDLREIILGSEGRIGILSEIKVRVSRQAEAEQFYVAFLPDWKSASGCTRELVQQRVSLSMLRVSNAIETVTQLQLAGHQKAIKLLESALTLFGAQKNSKCMMTFGITGAPQQNQSTLKQVRKILKTYKGVGTSRLLGNKWQANRFRFPYLRETLWNMGYAVDTLETATDWGNVDTLLKLTESSLRNGLTKENEQVYVFTHLSHVYNQGSSIYTSYIFRCADNYEETLIRWQKLKKAASQVIVENGGTISHQHGVGKDHAPYLTTEKSELGMKTLRHLIVGFDKEGLLNPETLISDE